MNKPAFYQESQGSRLGAINEQATHYFARLMTPPEVAVATQRQPPEVRQKTEGHWVLCGDVSGPMFKLLQKVPSKQFQTRLTAFNSSSGFAYCVLTHQVERHQHRFLLGLTDPAVRTFLESMTTTGKLTFMLGDDDGNNALLFESPLLPNMFMPVLAMAPEVNLETQRTALSELPCVQAVIGNPLQVPSLLEGYSVQYVSVSLLLPGFSVEQYEAAIYKASGV
ncbi:hypothetical protein [Rhodoferax ferrireducens]|uniref:hypothetical protein n=1 Tax=Rhodoferax ferrireducens TaxID=192843 RepID=UPI001300448B|nr:hypothetical protein [Rhodoferax ferrireducens]